MQKLIDKPVLLGLCLLSLSLAQFKIISLFALLSALAVSSLCSYFENRTPVYLCIAYVVVCIFVPEFAVFLPLIVYDFACQSNLVLRFCWIPAVFFVSPQIMAAVILSSGVAFLLQYRTASQVKTRDEYFTLMDNAKERAGHLEQKNRELMEKQDYEVRLATLAERNRIAREIHDNVGHLLTRSILQVGALRVTHTDDAKLADELLLVNDTLSGAMDSIRSSVHNLHDESVDLKMQLETMIDGFRFCPVKLRYNAGELPAEFKTCFAAIVREALSNIAKHSSATEAAVILTEHPAFCQLVIEDNGTAKVSNSKNGIGLQNMTDRVNALGGVFRVEHTKGFKIFISVPKERTL